VPGQGVGSILRTALTEGGWPMPRLAENVLADARGRARQLSGGTAEPADWIGRRQQRWTHGINVRN
jgi:hypothetical protein